MPDEELSHFCRVVTAFREYRLASAAQLQSRRSAASVLSKTHRASLVTSGFFDKLDQVEQCLELNSSFLDTCVDLQGFHEPASPMFIKASIESDPTTMSEHQNRIQAVLRQIAREWSSESAAERDASFGAAIRRLNEHFASTGANKADVRVLVPGAGLGRLSFDIWQNGYTCEGNEISYYMLLVSNIILNHAKQVCEYSIAPYASTFSNAYSVASQIRTVVFPDVLPVKSDGQFSMGMGEFTEIYAADEPAEWDAVVTCFFIDTSRNILQYIDTIHKILRRGGVWINVGPLLYHFEGRDDGKGSIELTLEELLEVIKQSGFEINGPVTFHDAGYAGDPQSMLKFSYTAAAFTAFRM